MANLNLKENNVKELYLGHCVTDDVIGYFEQNLREVNIVRLAAGKEFDVQLLPPTKTNN